MERKSYRLNGMFMTTREKAHRHLRRRLHLPDYYGANLDALHDCLCAVGVPTTITLVHASTLKKRLGVYGGKLISLLIACTGENPKLELVIRERW